MTAYETKALELLDSIASMMDDALIAVQRLVASLGASNGLRNRSIAALPPAPAAGAAGADMVAPSATATSAPRHRLPPLPILGAAAHAVTDATRPGADGDSADASAAIVDYTSSLHALVGRKYDLASCAAFAEGCTYLEWEDEA